MGFNVQLTVAVFIQLTNSDQPGKGGHEICNVHDLGEVYVAYVDLYCTYFGDCASPWCTRSSKATGHQTKQSSI